MRMTRRLGPGGGDRGEIELLEQPDPAAGPGGQDRGQVPQRGGLPRAGSAEDHDEPAPACWIIGPISSSSGIASPVCGEITRGRTAAARRDRSFVAPRPRTGSSDRRPPARPGRGRNHDPARGPRAPGGTGSTGCSRTDPAPARGMTGPGRPTPRPRPTNRPRMLPRPAPGPPASAGPVGSPQQPGDHERRDQPQQDTGPDEGLEPGEDVTPAMRPVRHPDRPGPIRSDGHRPALPSSDAIPGTSRVAAIQASQSVRSLSGHVNRPGSPRQ